jgi:uncharacterized damage-inducible protein DinB
MTDTDQRLTRVETKLDTLTDQWGKRFQSLESRLNGMFTFQMTWMTILIGVAIVVLKR